jgi:hypothetical protein
MKLIYQKTIEIKLIPFNKENICKNYPVVFNLPTSLSEIPGTVA